VVRKKQGGGCAVVYGVAMFKGEYLGELGVRAFLKSSHSGVPIRKKPHFSKVV